MKKSGAVRKPRPEGSPSERSPRMGVRAVRGIGTCGIARLGMYASLGLLPAFGLNTCRGLSEYVLCRRSHQSRRLTAARSPGVS